ncbi:centrosomal protein-related [Holotrichia oblita]|uniref:Centrosomal protein-related n=1 Tax=Holotrichia oblita TaxID=644536 RepID=A0ACB9TUG8_HOLOL|nr:centrosomal protein-related [Holotrichia oblita]
MEESEQTTLSKTFEDPSIIQSLDKLSDHSNFIPSKSESQSYRDKIRKRFKVIKEQASSSTAQPQILDFHKTVKLLKKENELLTASVNRRLRDITDYSPSGRYHFFCEDAVIADSRSDSNFSSNENRDQLLENVPPEVLQDFLELAMLNSFWYPQRNSTDTILQRDIRLLSDEGIYVLEQKRVPNLKLLQQRLAVDDKKWFNCEGKLKLTESPISDTSYRPPTLNIDEFKTEMIVPKDASVYELLDSIHTYKSTKLDLHISQIQFYHHPLFSIEHVFERKLLELYEKYKDKVVNNNLERINKKLDFLRNKTYADYSDADITNHFREIKRLRDLQITESREYRELLKNILRMWKIIKKIRKDKAFSNTRTKLVIYKNKCNYEEELRDYEKNVNTITSEILREKAEDYQQKLQEYKNDLKIWHDDKTMKRPKKPHNEIDEEEVRDNVTTDLMETFKPPGEPIITVDIQADNEITGKTENELENLRRQILASTKIYLKILFNGIEVCRSKQIALNDTFTCKFNETFSLQIEDIPSNIVIQIYEQPSTMLKRKLADVNVDISKIDCPSKLLNKHFLKEDLIHYNHEGVGSGCEFKELCKAYILPEIEVDPLNTNGSISYSVCYENIEHIGNSPMQAYQSLLNKDGHLDASKLAEWTNKVEIDPHNPHNTCLFEYIDADRINEAPDFPKSQNKYFRCNPELQRLIFYNSSNIEENTRFRVLALRNRNEPEFVGMVVPNRIKEIPTNVLTSYYKRIREEQNKCCLEGDENVESRISNGQKFLKQLHINIFQQCRSMPNNLTYDDVVNERLLSYFQDYIKVLIQNFLNWFKIRPDIHKPLPQLGLRKGDTEASTPAAPAKLLVNITSVINVPNIISLKKCSKSRQSPDIINTQISSTYISVSFDDMYLETATQEGTNPVWNEEMIFPLRSINIDYMSPNALNASILINLYINVLDKNSQQVGSNWLGFVKIPLSAVVYNGKMEGSFLLKSPVFLNYEQNLIYLNLKLRIVPNFPKLTINMKGLPCSEPPYLQSYLNHWNDDYNENYPHNNFSVFAIDSSGKTVCLTRYIRPLEPPQMNSNDFDITQEQCARYVSLIPFTDCNKLYDHIWLTTEEMLKLMIGSAIDHSITLTCFFLALNMEAWLLLGYGVPHGTTAYVLVREYDSNNIPIHYIYDSTTALKYNVTDSLCPLQKVICVVNDTNIWANVQRTHDLTLLQFDFTRSDWHCLFNNQTPAPTNSMQKKLNYYCRDHILQELQFHLEKKLRKQILKLRKTEKTIWNHYISNKLKVSIANLENNYISNKFDFHMKGIEHTQLVYGFVIDLPYSNISAIMDVIKASQIFDVGGRDKEYLFGIHLCLYPNQVLVIWMIVGFILCNKC